MFAPHTTTTTRSPRGGTVRADDQRGERRGPARLGDQVDVAPQPALRVADRLVGHQHDPIDPGARRGERDVADAPRSERVGGDPAHLDVDRRPGLERRVQRRTGLGLDAHDADVPAEPRRDPGDQPAAADGDQDGVGVGDLLGELEPDRAPAGHDLRLIERVHRERAGLGLARARATTDASW